MKNQEELTTVTYNFADNTKVVQPINKQAMFDEKGRKRSLNQLEHVFNTTANDKGKACLGYTLEGKASEDVLQSEPEFTKVERYNAKKDYKDFIKSNLKEFNNQKRQFQAMVIDKFTNTKMRVRMNATIIAN